MADTSIPDEDAAPVETCDVCVVGAGIAGLNALFVASRHLARDQRAILVDRRARVGGMWVDTYPYVRLHQPHGFFTAGDIKWTLDRDRSHLAEKGEVLDHFEHCLDVIRGRMRVDEFFGWEMESDTEADGIVRVGFTSPDGRTLVVETKRLIKAFGLGITPNDPLQLSSARVSSVSPDFCDVRDGAMRTSSTPVWIIGGGKTAMDTAHTVITEYPGREVNLVAGAGTYFSNRDRLFAAGARRWWGGTLASSMAAEMAKRFDGTNEIDVAEWMRRTYGLWSTPGTGNFFLGVLSESENATIAAGLHDVIMDHLVDVADRDGEPELVFRSGASKPIEPGSWVVNCTGYIRRNDHPYEPYVSAGGSVLSLQTRSATMHLPSYMAYYMTHLMFLGKLGDVPLYELDMQDMLWKSKATLPYTMFALASYNLSLMYDSMPAKAFQECGLDFDRWYPWPRRMLGTARFMLRHRREREHQRQTLDTIRDRFDVRCGPLPR
jgi:hypothetical protein